MNLRARPYSILVVASLLAMGCLSQPSLALDRTVGDTWVYDVRCSMAGVVVEGVMEYRYVGVTSVEVDGMTYETGVIRVDGDFSGYGDEFSYDVWVTGLFDGYVYESSDGIGIVKEELTTIANVSTGYEDFEIATLVETTESLTYSQPLLSGFDTEDWELTREWNETLTVFSFEAYSNGTVSSENESASESSFQFSAAPVPFPLETEAGAFPASMITFSDGGTLRIMWYSPEVGGFVRMERFDPPFSAPSFVAVLSDYEQGSGGDDLTLVLSMLGVGVALVVLASVVVVAVKRRTGGPPAGMPEDREGLSGPEPRDLGPDVRDEVK
ncbi:TPA: hypothetical protein HA259_04025 [Thermoplasmata archaeon]|nr:hypothetical protein [Thermoplasmata archaeon]